MTDDEINEELRDTDMAIMQRAARELRRRFDSVQIFTTREEPGTGDTVSADCGEGNFYARWGQVSLWTSSHEMASADRHIRDQEDDGDE